MEPERPDNIKEPSSDDAFQPGLQAEIIVEKVSEKDLRREGSAPSLSDLTKSPLHKAERKNGPAESLEAADFFREISGHIAEMRISLESAIDKILGMLRDGLRAIEERQQKYEDRTAQRTAEWNPGQGDLDFVRRDIKESVEAVESQLGLNHREHHDKYEEMLKQGRQVLTELKNLELVSEELARFRSLFAGGYSQDEVVSPVPRRGFDFNPSGVRHGSNNKLVMENIFFGLVLFILCIDTLVLVWIASRQFF